MARYKCPACGEPYRGGRCAACYYEPFTEEITHRLHTHKGEPLVIDTPVRKPIRQADPFGCDRRTRKKPARKLGIVFAILIVLLSAIGEVAETVMDNVSDTFLSVAEPEPVPDLTLPADSTLLYSGGGLRAIANWQDGMSWPGELPIYLVNDTGHEVGLLAQSVTVNGYVIDSAYLYDGTQNSELHLFYLYIDAESLTRAGIEIPAQISFRLTFFDTDSYETIAESDTIRLRANAPEDFVQPVDDSGALLWETDSLRVVFRGYQPDPDAPEKVQWGTLQFFIENTGSQALSIYSEDVLVDQGSVPLSLWCELPPGTRTITDMYLYGLDAESLDELKDLTMILTAVDAVSWDNAVTSGELPLEIR